MKNKTQALRKKACNAAISTADAVFGTAYVLNQLTAMQLIAMEYQTRKLFDKSTVKAEVRKRRVMVTNRKIDTLFNAFDKAKVKTNTLFKMKPTVSFSE